MGLVKIDPTWLGRLRCVVATSIEHFETVPWRRAHRGATVILSKPRTDLTCARTVQVRIEEDQHEKTFVNI
jgi:hypothetical protein